MEVGVYSLLACGYNAQSNQAVLGLRQSIPGLPIAIGLHPWFAGEAIDTVAELIASAAPNAVGECGLDAAANDRMPSGAVQRKAFEIQLEVACQTGLPVTVHSRRAVAVVFDMVQNFHDVRGVMHAFGGSYEQAKLFVDRGWLIGIGGAVTRANSLRVHGLARRLPLEGIALETDAPAIGMEGVCAPHVRPAHLPRIAAAIAKLRSIDLAELVNTTDNNAKKIFSLEVQRSVSSD